MRKIVIAAIALGVSVSSARADSACMTAADLSWMPSLARLVPKIDTARHGCVTGAEIAAYRAALKADRAGAEARIAQRLTAQGLTAQGLTAH